MKKWLSVFVLIAVCAICFNAYGDETTSSPDDSASTTFGLTPFKEKQTLRIGFFSGSPLSYPFLFAEKLGYFDELNIEIVLVPFTNGPAMIEANADWDIATCGEGGMCNAMVGYGMRVIDINDYEENLALFVRPGSPLAQDPNNPDNWKGTEWVYPAGTTAQAVLVSALKKVGLTLDDITSINMDVSNALIAFNGGTGDGLGVWNVFAFDAEDRGYMRIADSGSLGFKAPCGALAKAETIEEIRELIETAIAVFHFTVEWLYKSPENMEQAATWYLEHCLYEGLRCDESIAKRVMDWYRGPTMAEYIALFTAKSPDDAGLYTKRDLLQAEKDILVGLDFFISQGIYTFEDRNRILDNGLIDPTIALGVKDMLDELEISY